MQTPAPPPFPPAMPLRRPPPRPRAPRLPQPGFTHYFWAAAGSVLIGVTLPCVMVNVRVSLTRDFHSHPLQQILVTQLLATMGCGSVAVILSMVMMAMLTLKTIFWTAKKSIMMGAAWGVPVAFLNIPGYGALFFLWEDAYPALRLALLFIVAGSTCGMWIGWQAWRGFHPQEGFLPRFTLRTMLMIVFLWGTVMVAFQPDRERRDVWTNFKNQYIHDPSDAPDGK